MEGLPDERLLEQMAARDETALKELHRRYVPYLSAVAKRMLQDPDEVHQCVQDAFVNAWDYAARYDPAKSSVKTWLVTITQRLAINRIRKTRLETLPLQSWDAPARQPDHLERIHIQEAVSELGDEARELIDLAFYQGFSHAQVAEVTGKPLGTVKTKLRGALQTLRDRLKGEA